MLPAPAGGTEAEGDIAEAFSGRAAWQSARGGMATASCRAHDVLPHAEDTPPARACWRAYTISSSCMAINFDSKKVIDRAKLGNPVKTASAGRGEGEVGEVVAFVWHVVSFVGRLSASSGKGLQLASWLWRGSLRFASDGTASLWTAGSRGSWSLIHNRGEYKAEKR